MILPDKLPIICRIKAAILTLFVKR